MTSLFENILSSLIKSIANRLRHFSDYFFGKVGIRINSAKRFSHQYSNYNITEVTVLVSNNTKRLQSITSAWVKFPSEKIEATMVHSISESDNFLRVKMSLPIPVDLLPGQAKLISMHFSDSLPGISAPSLLEIELTGIQRKSIKLNDHQANLKVISHEAEKIENQNV